MQESLYARTAVLPTQRSSWLPYLVHPCVTATGVGPRAMASPADEAIPGLPPVLQLDILSLLPPNDLALGGRLSCKDAAQRFSQPHHRTARLSQPLPGHAVTAAGATTATWCVEAAQTALRELTFRRKLLLLSTAAASGCEANVEFAWQLLQPHVFPELLQTDHYLTYLKRSPELQVQDAGSAAIASGLAHLLPSLAQRCPGLLDPGATLEAAARHCDLAGLRAAWEVVGQRLLSSLRQAPLPLRDGDEVHGVWLRLMAAAAGSSISEAMAKMEWIYTQGQGYAIKSWTKGYVWGAAAASGDLARLRWLQERRFPWGGAEALAAVLRHADLDFIVRMEQEGGFLPPAGDGCWGSADVAPAAAASPHDSAAKLSWLADRGVEVGTLETVKAAAGQGNLAALQRALQHWRQRQHEEGRSLAPPPAAMLCAVRSGHVPTATWLHQAGGKLQSGLLRHAFGSGHLPMLRCLLEAGCPTGDTTLAEVVSRWPSDTPADGELLVEALWLLAAAGLPARDGRDMELLSAVGCSGHPWAVCLALEELGAACVNKDVTARAVCEAVATGCEATLEGLARLGVISRFQGAGGGSEWYAAAAKRGDRATLSCLQRLRVPVGKAVRAAAMRSGAPMPALRWLVGDRASTQSAGGSLGGGAAGTAAAAISRRSGMVDRITAAASVLSWFLVAWACLFASMYTLWAWGAHGQSAPL